MLSEWTTEPTSQVSSDQYLLSPSAAMKMGEEMLSTRSCTNGPGSSRVSTDNSDLNQILSIELNQKPSEQDYEDSGDFILVEVRGRIERVCVSDPIQFDLACDVLARDYDLAEDLLLSLKVVVVDKLHRENCMFESTHRQLMKQYSDIKFKQLMLEQ